MKKIKFIDDFIKIISNMYRLGWNERNGGNISYLIDEKEFVNSGINLNINRLIKVNFDMTELIGKRFLVTGTGKYFKNVEDNPEENIGIVEVVDKDNLGVLWGFNDGVNPTSELPSHFMTHIERLKINPKNKVVIHTHPTNIIAMTFIHSLDEREFTRTLWRMCTECLVVFPDGVGVLPWMLCGNGEIGIATTEKMKKQRLVVWAHHGIFGTGESIDEAFGLIETAEKAAEIYLKICDKQILQTITDSELKILADKFNVIPRIGYLD